jgi:hypothetical protein
MAAARESSSAAVVTRRDSFERYLDHNAAFLEEYLVRRSDAGWLRAIADRIGGRRRSHADAHEYNENVVVELPDDEDADEEDRSSVVPRTPRKSVTSDLFQQWLLSPRIPSPGASRGAGFGFAALGSASPTSLSAEVSALSLAEADTLHQNDRLMELILDISNELNIDVLCYKILVNVGLLLLADRCSLFLARGPRDNRHLEAKLFDVSPNTSKNNGNAHIFASSFRWARLWKMNWRLNRMQYRYIRKDYIYHSLLHYVSSWLALSLGACRARVMCCTDSDRHELQTDASKKERKT